VIVTATLGEHGTSDPAAWPAGWPGFAGASCARAWRRWACTTCGCSGSRTAPAPPSTAPLRSPITSRCRARSHRHVRPDGITGIPIIAPEPMDHRCSGGDLSRYAALVCDEDARVPRPVRGRERPDRTVGRPTGSSLHADRRLLRVDGALRRPVGREARRPRGPCLTDADAHRPDGMGPLPGVGAGRVLPLGDAGARRDLPVAPE
jgi:hypothetical protein